jgi:hypothetical protein
MVDDCERERELHKNEDSFENITRDNLSIERHGYHVFVLLILCMSSNASPEQLDLGRLCLHAMPSALGAGYSNVGNQPAILPMPWSCSQSLLLTLNKVLPY